MQKLVINCSTGEQTMVDLTPKDVAQQAADTAAWEAEQAKPVPPDPDAELEAAITAAATIAELKAALLGKTRAGKIKGQAR